MSRLTEYHVDKPDHCISVLDDHSQIAATLEREGILFEQWQTDQDLAEDANQEQVLAVYEQFITNLNNQYGFKSIDVVSMHSATPNAEEIRRKFLDEHAHEDFEVRFFVAGRGLFYLHIDDKVYLLLCEQGDLVSIPAGVKHWFDMGTKPCFKCIRFFTTANGWEANFTGNDIASRFQSFDEYMVQI